MHLLCSLCCSAPLYVRQEREQNQVTVWRGSCTVEVVKCELALQGVCIGQFTGKMGGKIWSVNGD